MVKITEVFQSIQGEGPTIGIPVTFVRFFGCNLRCQYGSNKCDSFYSVKGQGKEYKDYTVDETVNEIKKYNNRHIVFTGGEPLLYQKFIMDIMLQLNNNYENGVIEYIADVETNGTIPIAFYLHPYINLFVISPKLESSNQEEEFESIRVNLKALSTFNMNKSVFKFVVDNDNDLDEAKRILNEMNVSTAYLMPMGENRETIIENSKKLVKYCLDNKLYNFIFSPREHIIIWNNERGR